MTPCAVYSLVPRAGGHTLAGRARKLLEQSGFCAMPKVFANMEAPRPRVRLANDYSSRQLGASEALSPCVANAAAGEAMEEEGFCRAWAFLLCCLLIPNQYSWS